MVDKDDTIARESAFPEPEDLAAPQGSFSLDASAERAPKLASALREHFRLQLLNALRHAGEALGGLKRLQELWADLDANLPFGPALFAAYGSLMDAMHRGSPEAVVDACQGLWVITNEAVHDAKFRAGSILEESWEAAVVALMRREFRRDGLPGPVAMQPLLDRDLSLLSTTLNRARALMESADPDLAAEFEANVTRVKWFAGHGIDSASSPRALGAIFLRVPLKEEPVGFVLSHLVRESASIFLQTLRVHDPLLKNGTEIAADGPLKLPLQVVLNTAVGAHRAVRVFERAATLHPGVSFDAPLAAARSDLESALSVLRRQGAFTPSGFRLVAGFGISGDS